MTNNGVIPTPAQYKGPLFKLSHNWPASPPPPLNPAPWSKAIGGGLITVQNAEAYVAALKQYVELPARKLLLDPNFDAAAFHWYTEPWLGLKRESIHGTYEANTFGPDDFKDTGLLTTFLAQDLTYYDERAAYTLYKVWGASALNPAIQTANFQFMEGAVVVKLGIFVSDPRKPRKDWWPVTNGAAAWPLFFVIPSDRPGPVFTGVRTGYVMQFDIIVKDSKSSPKTGWVFSTLVYDGGAPGADAWDKMVPLGAMWGNDPDANSALNPPPPVTENWINPNAPGYSTITLGWGGRLSGPNDGARNDIQVGKVVMKRAQNSACMSCHGSSEWQVQQHKTTSFILPSYPNPNPGPPYKTCPDGKPNDPYICSPAPGSADWFKWFQSRPGTAPQEPESGSVATDYDLIFAFKTLPMWWKLTGPPGQPEPFAMRTLHNGRLEPKKFNEYSGAPLRKPE